MRKENDTLQFYFKHHADKIKFNDRDYQIDVDQEGIYLYDDGRYLGFTPYEKAGELKDIIFKDNQ